jgi:hypothetical protein
MSLWRAFQRRFTQPWWFASVDPADPHGCGRFDLPAPYGACYLGTSKAAAVLEAFADFSHGLLPAEALRRRAAAELTGPDSAPSAAQLTAAKALGLGVTAALWAGPDRPCTQAWADGLHRAGWRAAYHGIQHDPAGRLRAVTLFDRAGTHPPFDDADGWAHTTAGLHDDPDVAATLARFGLEVTRDDVELEFAALDDVLDTDDDHHTPPHR